MATTVCKLNLRLVVLICIAIAARLTSCGYVASVPGQARPDDPHACLWFEAHTGSKVYRCCDGYFKNNATNLIDNCIECPSGTFGPFCKKNCSCENGGTCNIVDGSCHCSGLHFGNSCQYSCNCQNGGTCLSDGTCTCMDGWYGDVCEKECLCPDNSLCDSKTGKCSCRDGFYGSSCLQCTCSKNEQCDPSNGRCSCSPGYYGENCDKHCSCFNGAYCVKDHLDSCKCSSGWIGSGCSDCDKQIVHSNGLSFCEDKCLHCYNGHTCSVENSDCECSAGWQGNRCDQKCESGFYGNNCSEECNCERGSCDHVTGTCECDTGYTGHYCNHTCPENCVICKGDVCTSCKAGWTGKRCTGKCEPGFYGVACKDTCPQCNCTTSCNHIHGRCPDVVRCEEHECKYDNVKICIENPFRLVCLDGRFGDFCDDKTTMTTTNDVNLTDSHDITIRPMEDDATIHDNNVRTWILVPAIVGALLSVLLGLFAVCVRYKLKLGGRLCYSNQENRIPTTTSAVEKDMITTSTNLELATKPTNMKECNGSVESGIRQNKQKEIPEYASVRKHKNRTQQSDAIGTKNQDIEAVENDSLIQKPIEKSASLIRALSCEGPYEIVPIDKIRSNSSLGLSETSYDMLDGLRYAKQYKNINASSGEYELLKLPIQPNNSPPIT